MRPIAKHTIKISWNGEKYEVRIPELGPDVKAYAETYELAEIKAIEVIAQYLVDEKNRQNARAS